jgi:hypothetical protein
LDIVALLVFKIMTVPPLTVNDRAVCVEVIAEEPPPILLIPKLFISSVVVAKWLPKLSPETVMPVIRLPSKAGYFPAAVV